MYGSDVKRLLKKHVDAAAGGTAMLTRHGIKRLWPRLNRRGVGNGFDDPSWIWVAFSQFITS